ncbi:MAG: hypothetical protein QM639_02115 [Rhodocyclaceae bacterium]
MSRIDELLAARIAVAGKTSVEPAAPDSNRQSAWHREMERAQRDAWLDHPLLSRSALSAPPLNDSIQRTDPVASASGGALANTEADRSLASRTETRASHSPISPERASKRTTIAHATEQMTRGLPSQQPFCRHEASSIEIAPHSTSAVEPVVTIEIVETVSTAASSAAVGALDTQAATAAVLTKRPQEDARFLFTAARTAREARVEKAVTEEVTRYAERLSSTVSIPQEPVRVTAQWTGDSVALWLGVAQPQAHDLAGLIRRLRALVNDQGVQLVSVVCNGKPWDGGALNEQSQADVMSGENTTSLD